MAFNKLEFEQFLEYVDNIADMEKSDGISPDIAIVEYVKAHTLTNTQSYAVAVLLCKINNPVSILEFIKNSKGIFDKNFFNWLGSKIYESDNFDCMDGFVSLYPNCSINQFICQKMVENNKHNYLYGYVNSESTPVELKETILMTFINYGSLKQFVDFTQNCFEFVAPRLAREDIKENLNNLVKKEQAQEVIDSDAIEICNGVMQATVEEVKVNSGFEKVKTGNN